MQIIFDDKVGKRAIILYGKILLTICTDLTYNKSHAYNARETCSQHFKEMQWNATRYTFQDIIRSSLMHFHTASQLSIWLAENAGHPCIQIWLFAKPSVVILIGQQKKQISVLDILFSRKIHKFKPPVYWLSPVRGKLIFQSHFIMYTSTSVTSQGTLKTPY